MADFHRSGIQTDSRKPRNISSRMQDFLDDAPMPYITPATPASSSLTYSELEEHMKMRVEKREDLAVLETRNVTAQDFLRNLDARRVSFDPLVDVPDSRPQLSHYKLIADTTHSEYAALLVKFDSQQSEVRDLQNRLALKEASMEQMKAELENYKENSARQASLIMSLRDHVKGTETLSATKSQADTSLRALQRENWELKESVTELKDRLRLQLSEREDAEHKATHMERRLTDITAKLASCLKINTKGPDNPLDAVILKVSELCEEHFRQQVKIASLMDALASQDQEFKASRETIMKLVSEVSRQKRAAATCTDEMKVLKKERDEALLAKATSNREGKLLWERLEESQKAWDASRQEQLHTEHEKKQMGDLLHSKLQEAKAAHHLYKTFLSQLANLLSNGLITVPESEEAVTERIQELCSQVKDRKDKEEECEKRIGKLSRQLEQQCELQHETMGRAQKAEQQLQEQQQSLRHLQGNAASKDLLKDSFFLEKQKHLKFVNELRKKLKVEEDISEDPLHSQYDVLLTRAEELGSLDGESYSDCKNLIHILQKKVTSQKEKLESKKTELEGLYKKIKTLEGAKETQFLLMMEKKQKSETVQKLEKKVEKLQDQLSEAKCSNQTLKNKLAETKNLQVKTAEQSKTIEVLNKSLEAAEKIKDKAAQKVVSLKTELDHTESEVREEKERAQYMLEAISNELRTVKRALEQVATREKRLIDFRESVTRLLGFNTNTMSIPDHEILSQLKSSVQPYGNQGDPAHNPDNSPAGLHYGFRDGYNKPQHFGATAAPPSQAKVQYVSSEKKPGKAAKSAKW
ncbi:coiled-coil domain-containing protein 170-like [Acipenser oxyrinchus oxyrinchus]|uniref:Coiled-coil domain-containing protein 170-like n=1 Tax=Acipenser oxyrinchus oxyrinchus TaxID=40147 RepID=A0AAD8FWQ0_ACIOX|nr:coiled-coil domain-containing protein 170-like [Acipenser oxyrinchus oxyrinchus]